MANPAGGGGESGGGRTSGSTQQPVVNENVVRSINAAAAASAKLTDTFREQLRIMLELQSLIEKVSQGLQKSAGAVGGDSANAGKAVQEVTTKLKEEKSALEQVNASANKTAKTMKGTFSKSMDVAKEAAVGLVKGFSNFVAIGTSIGGIIGKLVGGFFSVGKAIIAIPFKMIQGLFEMAESGGGGTELAQAYENVREQFGDLKSGFSKNVIDVASSLDRLNSTGVSAQAIYGNLAQRIEAINKLAGGLGMTMNQFSEEFAKSGAEISRFQRGLGMTEEQVQDVARAATRQGTTMGKVYVDMTKHSDALSKSLGINVRMMRKDMAKAMADTAHFAHLSNKEMAVAVAYANKLGLSIDKLTASMDSTATFDQAAEQMGKLNETFGTNIDATEVMMAQSGAEKFEIISKQLRETGKDMSRLSMHERMLLKQQTSWDDATLDAAISSKNFGVSLGNIAAQADKAENKAMSVTDAMKNLSSEIVRKPMEGPQSKGGIFDRFLDGMNKGIQSTPEFLKLMRNIKIVFMDAYMSGMKLGRFLFYIVPGMKDIVDGFGDLFDPKKFRKFFDGIIKTFEVFKTGGSVKFEDFLKLINKNFLDFFDKEKGPGKKIIEGFRKFFDVVIKIFSSAAVFAIEELSKLIDIVVDWIKNPKIPNVQGGGKWATILDPLVKVFDAAVDKLWPAIKKLAGALWDKLVEAMSGPIGMGIMAASAGIIFGPAIVNAIVAIAKSGMFSKAASKAAGAAGGTAGVGKDVGAMATEAATGAVAAAGKQQEAMASSPSAMMSSAIPDKATIKKMEEATESKINWTKLTQFLVGIAGVFAIGLVAFKAAIVMVRGEKAENIVKAAIVMSALVPMLAAAGVLAYALSKVEKFDWKAASQAVIATGAAMVVIAGVARMVIPFFAGVKIDDAIVATSVMLAFEPMFFAAGVMVAAAVPLGKYIKDKGKDVSIGIAATGGVLIVIAGFARAAIAILGGTKIAEITATAAAMTMMEGLFLGAELIVAAAAALGKFIKDKQGETVAGLAAAGLTLVAIGGLALLAVSQLGKIPPDQLTRTGDVMKMMSLMFLAAGVLVLGAMGLGMLMLGSEGIGAAAALLGLLSVMAMVASIVMMAEIAIQGLGNFTKSQIDNTSAAMFMMTKLFAFAGLLVIEAAAVGVVALATAGVALAGAAAMSKAIDSIADTSKDIIKKMGDLEVSKIETTTAAMTLGVQLFSIAGDMVLKAADIGTKKLIGIDIDGSMKLISGAIENISNVVSKIITDLSNIKDDPNAVETKSRAFKDILSAVSEMASAIGKIVQGLDFGFFGDFSNDKIRTISKFIDSLISGGQGIEIGKGGIIGIVNTIAAAVKEVPVAQLEAAKGFTSIMSGISGMIEAITKPALSLVKTADGFTGIDTGALEKTMKYTSNFFEKVGGSAKDIVQGIISSLGSSLKGMSKDQLDSMSAVGDLLKSIVDIIGAVSAATSSKKVGDLKVDKGAMVSIVDNTPGIGKMIEELSKSAPDLISNVISLTRKVPTDKDFNEKVKTLSSVIDMFSKMMKTISDIGSAGKQNETPIQAFTNGLLGMRDILMMLAGEYPGNKDVGLHNLIGFVQRIPLPKDGIAKKGKEIASTLDSITGILSAIKDPLAGPAKESGNITMYVAGVLGNAHGVLRLLMGDPGFFNGDFGLHVFTNMIYYIADKAATNTSGNKVKKITGEIVETLNGITSILSAVNNLPKSETANPAETLTKRMKDIATTLGSLVDNSEGPGLNALVVGIQTIQKTLPQGYSNTVKAITTQLTSLLTEIGNIARAITGISFGSQDVTSASAGLATVNSILGKLSDNSATSTTSMQKISEKLSAMSSIEVGAAKKAASNLKTLLDSLSAVATAAVTVQDINVDTVKFTNSLTAINNLLSTASSSLGKDGKEDKDGILAGIKSIKDKGFAPNIKAAQELLVQSKQLEGLMQSLPKLEFSAKLQTLANGLGLGGQYNYTIGPNKPVVINICMSVFMDAASVEKAVVHRSNSIIRDRINFAIGGGNGDNKQLPQSLTVGNKDASLVCTQVTG